MSVRPPTQVIILRGPAPDRLSSLAIAINALLPGKAARVPLHAFRTAWVTTDGVYNEPDLDLSYRLGKLVSVSYVREGYHVVVEDAATGDPAQERLLAEMIALLRTMPVRATVVDCASPNALLSTAGPLSEQRIELNTPVDAAARAIVERLDATGR